MLLQHSAAQVWDSKSGRTTHFGGMLVLIHQLPNEHKVWAVRKGHDKALHYVTT